MARAHTLHDRDSKCARCEKWKTNLTEMKAEKKHEIEQRRNWMRISLFERIKMYRIIDVIGQDIYDAEPKIEKGKCNTNDQFLFHVICIFRY